MMLEILDMPEEPRELAAWLDRHLASDGLAAIVDDLSAVHAAPAELCSVEQAREWLGDAAPLVLANGLGAIGDERIKQLLVRPSLLPALQELVMLEGGPYWDNLLHHSAGVQESLSRARSALSSVIAVPASASKNTVTPRSEQGNRRYLFTLIPLAVAAVLAPGGRFVAYQVRPRVAAFTSPHLGAPKFEWEAWNIPPMRVFTWVKPATSARW
jgi:hypothetical protein